MSEGGLFSIPAFFIVFRETLEAAIICSVLLAVLKKTGLKELNKYVWIGVGLGIAFTLVVLVAVLVIFHIATDAAIDNLGGLNETEAEAARERA